MSSANMYVFLVTFEHTEANIVTQKILNEVYNLFSDFFSLNAGVNCASLLRINH